MDEVYKTAFNKGIKAFTYGLKMSDMGTRRRTSFDVQSTVVYSIGTAYGTQQRAHVPKHRHNCHPSTHLSPGLRGKVCLPHADVLPVEPKQKELPWAHRWP